MWAYLQIIIKATNYFIYFENWIVGYQWLTQFFEQNYEYYIQKQNSLVVGQKHSYNIHNISDYFEKIKQVIREKKIINLDV